MGHKTTKALVDIALIFCPKSSLTKLYSGSDVLIRDNRVTLRKPKCLSLYNQPFLKKQF